jgi:hypothetical protein
MSRSRASAKQAGARFERVIADALAMALDDSRIDRRVKSGAKDRGDIGGVRTHGNHGGDRIVIEVKDYGGRLEVGPWLTEAEIERGNDDALVGLVVAKRRGHSDPLEQTVLMTVRDLVALLTGERVDR